MNGRDNGNNFSCPFITGYSHQHFSIKKLLSKHWHIVKNDGILGPVLPDRPQVVFRGVPSIKSFVGPSVCDPPTTKPMFFQNLVGYYRCKSCAVCSINAVKDRKVSHFHSTSTSHDFPIKYFITCSTVNVVYLLTCPCGLQYVGRTVRPLQVWLNEHIGNIRRGFKGHPVSKHYLDVHWQNPKGTSFVGIDRLKLPWRGGPEWRAISKLEMEWIYKIRCLRPLGLNVDIEINAFIDNA